MATQMHFEARRRQNVLDKAQEERERREQEAEKNRPSTSQQSSRSVDREWEKEEVAKMLYRDLKRQEKTLRNNCLVMGPIEKYVDDETVEAKIADMEKTNRDLEIE
eukprot:m.41210 g.41210  ORF g.41210 m.41210 type:complete len:106 (+) comp33107_c0_seq1:5937-6254(+)